MSRILLILICFAVITVSNGKEGSGHRKNSRPSQEKHKELVESFLRTVNIPYLSESLSWIVWFFRGLLGFVCFVVNTVIITVTQVTAGILSAFQILIRVIEFIGYCVRVVLQANYSFVLSSLKSIQHLGELCFEFVRDLFYSTAETLRSLITTVCNLLHSCVIGIPKLFEAAEQAGKVSMQAAGVAVKKSYTGCKQVAGMPALAAWDIISVIRAVIELIISTIVNTALLLYDLIKAGFAFITSILGRGGRTVLVYLIKMGQHFKGCLEWMGFGMQSIVTGIFRAVKSLLYGIYCVIASAVEFIYSTLYALIYSIGWSIGKLSEFLVTTVNHILSGIVWVVKVTVKSFQRFQRYLGQSNPGGKYSIISVTSTGLVIFSMWHVFGVNVFTVCFEALETAIQNLVSVLNRRHNIEDEQEGEGFPEAHEEQPSTSDNKPPRGASDDKHVNKLREELERERDKTLCVVCADQPKQILIMPCRHMCLCSRCADSLISQWNRRVCPLCRCRIRTIIEVYS